MFVMRRDSSRTTAPRVREIPQIVESYTGDLRSGLLSRFAYSSGTSVS